MRWHPPGVGFWDRVCVPRIQLAEEPHAATAAAHTTGLLWPWLCGRHHDLETKDGGAANRCNPWQNLILCDPQKEWQARHLDLGFDMAHRVLLVVWSKVARWDCLLARALNTNQRADMRSCIRYLSRNGAPGGPHAYFPVDRLLHMQNRADPSHTCILDSELDLSLFGLAVDQIQGAQ